jgi:hypothetical protein
MKFSPPSARHHWAWLNVGSDGRLGSRAPSTRWQSVSANPRTASAASSRLLWQDWPPCRTPALPSVSGTEIRGPGADSNLGGIVLVTGNGRMDDHTRENPRQPCRLHPESPAARQRPTGPGTPKRHNAAV